MAVTDQAEFNATPDSQSNIESIVTPVAQGPAKKATTAQIDQEVESTYTDPNLHRRIMNPYDESPSGQYYYDYDNLPPGKRMVEEFKPRNNELGVYGFNSYRTFIRYFHNEDATGIDGSPNEDEIP